jgi:hypothetical protein
LNSFRPYKAVSSGMALDLSGVGVRNVRKGGRAEEG